MEINVLDFYLFLHFLFKIFIVTHSTNLKIILTHDQNVVTMGCNCFSTRHIIAPPLIISSARWPSGQSADHHASWKRVSKMNRGNPLFTNRKVHLAGAYSSVKISECWKVCIKGHLTVPCCSVSAAHAAGSGIPNWLPGHWVAAAGSCAPSLTASLWLTAGSVTRYHRKWVGKTSLGWRVWKIAMISFVKVSGWTRAGVTDPNPSACHETHLSSGRRLNI